MKTFKTVFTCVLMSSTIFLLSCNNDLNSPKSSLEEIPKLTNTEMKKEFGAALAKVLKDSPATRKLIKEEALKQIDYDYDVLYLLIKDCLLQDNMTLEQCLLEYIDEPLLESIKTQIPNLTIFVPKLPENSFSAELWDVQRDIPYVGIQTSESNDIPVFDSTGESFLIEAQYIPAYPIVVIKENERIIVEKDVTKSTSNVSFLFIDDVFNNMNGMNETKSDRNGGGSNNLPIYRDEQIAKVYEAFDVYEKVEGWQRDYVYYNIKPGSERGPYQRYFGEALVGFEMEGDALACYNKLADQVDYDPHYDSELLSPSGRGNRGGWTEGEFEFKIKMYLGSGADLTKYLRLSPDQLFELQYKTGGNGNSSNLRYYVLDGLKLKKLVATNLPLFEWDLHNYASFIKLTIEEVDPHQTVKNGITINTEFASNFGFDMNFGEDVKIGMKFGVSGKITKNVSYEVTVDQGNDELGEVYVNFSDDIILGKETITLGGRRNPKSQIVPIYNNKYSTGWCKLYIAPLKTN